MKTKIAILLSAFSVQLSALADLSAHVTPGYTLSSGERATTDKLNRMANPTITISGTIGGTNAGLAAGSINGTHLSDATVDGTNIIFNSARQLSILSGGVLGTQIGAALAGDGLGGGSGTNLFIKTDPAAGIITTNDTLTLSNVPPGLLNVTSNYVVVGPTNNRGQAISITAFHALAGNGFVSAEYTIAAGQIANTNHGLGITPGSLRWVLVCKTYDPTGYVVGDEINIRSLYSGGSDNFMWADGANATNVFLACQDDVLSNLKMINKTNGNKDSTFVYPRWKAKCYARP
jgi:hypothetical protein